MKGFRLWVAACWGAALLFILSLLPTGAFFPGDINYDHYFEMRILTLLFVMHAISMTLVCGALKKLVKEPLIETNQE